MLKRFIKALVTAAIWVGVCYYFGPAFALSLPFLVVLGLMLILNTYQPDFQSGDSGPSEDKRSAQFIVLSVTLPNLIFTLECLFLRPAESIVYTPLELGFLAIAVFGLAARIHAIHTLGKFFTWHVHIAGDQQLIQDGLYRWLRHPSYFGAFLLFGAIPLTLNAYFAAATSLVMQFLAYRYRVGIEEEAMIATFGDTYRAYREKTYAFLPGIY